MSEELVPLSTVVFALQFPTYVAPILLCDVACYFWSVFSLGPCPE
jgi:hypothetical protein